MDYRFFFVVIFIFCSVECQDVAKNESSNALANNTVPEKAVPALPNLCTVCNCTDDFINCEEKGLTDHFDDSQWPKNPVNVVSFKGNSLVHLKPFPKVAIEKLILQENEIAKIDDCAFKQLVNLTELDLSHNKLTSIFLRPQVFEGRFSPESYEPLAKLTTLNLAHNVLHSLHQDLFEHMIGLKVLSLAGNPFTTIDIRTSIAISSLVYLEELDLSYCSLQDLPEHQFHTLLHIRRLNLTGNRFINLPNTLDEAKSLEVLSLDENPFEIINKTRGFPTLPRLKELSLCCMPHLTTIGSGAFSGLTGLENLRIGNCPKLEAIDEAALAAQTEEGPVWPPLKKLDLSDNALRYLPSQFVARWDWLEELDLMNNKWSCDCDNQYLIGTLLPKYGTKWMADKLNTLTCSAPPEHAGKNLTSLSHRKLRCLDIYGAQPEKDAAVLIGVLLGLLLAIPVCLTFFVLWRRGFFFCGGQGPASFSRAFYKRASNDDDL